MQARFGHSRTFWTGPWMGQVWAGFRSVGRQNNRSAQTRRACFCADTHVCERWDLCARKVACISVCARLYNTQTRRQRSGRKSNKTVPPSAQDRVRYSAQPGPRFAATDNGERTMAVAFWTILGVVLHLQAARSESLEVVVKEPQGPIVAGSDITLECLSNDFDSSSCKFQMYQRWIRIWMNIDTTNSLRCWFYNINVTRLNGDLLLQVKNIYKWHAGPYRCVCNSTDGEIASQAITVPLQYLNDICIQEQQSHFIPLFRGVRTMRVMKGKDLDLKCTASSSQTPLFQWQKQGSDWIYPNSSLRIKEITPEDGGTYTCKATHPLVPTLTISKSILIVVLKEPLSSWQLSEMNLILAVALPAGILLLAAVGITACIRGVRERRAKGMPLLDDDVVKTPIWKAGSSATPITISDTVPLVM